MLKSVRSPFALFGAGVMLVTVLALLLVPGLLHTLVSPGFFMPHRHCYLDNPRMIWLQGLSDSLIGAAYMAISGTLAYLVWKTRADLPFKWMFLAFGLFIFSCGWTHLMEVWTLWHPTYWLSGTIKAVTAAASLATAVGFVFLVPHVFGLIETAKASEQRRRDLAKSHEELQRAYARLEGEEARARLAAIVEYSEDAIISMNLVGLVTSWNAAAEQLLGYRAEEMMGKSMATIIPAERQQEEAGILERLRRGESMRHYETVRVARDGRRIEVSLTVSPLRDLEGRIIGASKILRDVTERNRAGEQLRLQSAALQSAANAISITDREGDIQWCNPAFERLTGYSAAELLGKNHRLLKSGKQGTEFYKELWDTIAAGRVWRGEVFNKRKDGSLYDEEMTITPVKDPRGVVSHFIAVKQDVTKRKQAEEALRESEQRFRQLADAMPQIVWAARPDGNLDYFNRKWYELTGAKEGETGDQSWLPILHPEDRQMCLDVWYESVRTGHNYEIEYRFKSPGSGDYRWHLGRALPVRNGQGNIVRWFGTSTDVDDMKRTEAALAEARDKLEQTVAERTAQLVEANSNLQSFAYTAAHDLRSPLRSIHNFSSLVLDEYGASLSPDGQSMLQRAVGCAEQMERLLNDLLEYSKMSQAELKLEPVSLQKAVSEALGLLDADIRGKNAAVNVTEPLPEVIGHMATVVLLINNFVSNALKFMPPGVQPRVRIWAEQCESRVRLCVQDNGIGIDPQDLGKMFTAFQRLHGKQAYPGTGLGLAIVRKGAERMGGRVGVESEPGKGSRFWVDLRQVVENKGADGQVPLGKAA